MTMPREVLRTPIHETVPSTVAWYEGSRVWIAASPDSRLAKWLAAHKAFWDPERRAWWLGRAKFSAELLDEIQAHVRRVNWVHGLREHGVRVELYGPPERCKDLVRAHGGIRMRGATYVVPDVATASALCAAAKAEGIAARWSESSTDELTDDVARDEASASEAATSDVGTAAAKATETPDLVAHAMVALLRATPVVADVPVEEEVARIVVGSATVASVRRVSGVPGLVEVSINKNRWLVPDWPFTNNGEVAITLTLTTQDDDHGPQGCEHGRSGC